jgi:DNA-directed RNA polymerase specialized sigma24 family protein
LAALLVGDAGTAEAVVQDCFVAMHGAWNRLADQDRALSYLHHAIVARSRSVLGSSTGGPIVGGTSADSAQVGTVPVATVSAGAWPVVVAALSTLPPLQREAIVLRFYLDLPGRAIATAMGISEDDAYAYTTGGIAAMQFEL